MSRVDEIKERLAISEVAGQYVKLQRSGVSGMKGRCPFHNEKTPSFHVSDDKNMFYCFGCGKGGDIITFIQEIESLTFKEALAFLSERAGLPPEEVVSKNDFKKGELYRINETASKLYQVAFRKDKEVVDYMVRGRGLSKETLKTFQIGYTGEGLKYVVSNLLRKKFAPEKIVEAGLAIESRGELIDRFRERIMFPISDTQGRVVGFSGRIFAKPGSRTDTTKVGKYINTKDTPVFDKSSVLFGYHIAKREMMRKDRVVVVEGQMDVLAFHEAGIKEVVGISGTAMTEKQVALIERFTDNVILALDGDEAGLKAMRRSMDVLLAKNMSVKVVRFEDGKDPNDILLEGSESLGKLIESAKDFFEVYMEPLAEYDISATRKFLNKDIFPLVAKIDSPIYKERIMEKVSELSSLKPATVYQEFEKWTKSDKHGIYNDIIEDKNSNVAKHSLQDTLVAIYLWQKNKNKNLVEKIRNFFKHTFGEDIDKRTAEGGEDYYGKIIFNIQGKYPEDLLEGSLEDIMRSVELARLSEEKREIDRKIRNSEKPEEELLKKLQHILSRMDEIKRSMIKDNF